MVTLPNIDISQMLLSTLALIQMLVPKVATAIKERLERGDSPEVILRELVHSAGDTPEEKGLAHHWLALYYIAEGRNESALDECSAARRAWPELSPAIHFFEAHILLSLRSYDDAFSAFEASREMLWLILDGLQEIPGSASYVEQKKVDFYKKWVLPGVMQGLEGLLPINLDSLFSGGEKVVAVLRHARQDGQEDAIWGTIAELEKNLPAELQPQMQEFRTFVELIAIEDPFEGLRALQKRISAVWPKDVDCVDAVREQRR